MPTSAERVARNDVIFRNANEQIRAAAEEHGVETRVPFVCECAEETCRELVRLTLDDYTAVRENELWFVTAPGHEAEASTAVVERYDGYVVIEKVGEAARIVEDLTDRPLPESEPVERGR